MVHAWFRQQAATGMPASDDALAEARRGNSFAADPWIPEFDGVTAAVFCHPEALIERQVFKYRLDAE